jgi:hypothetical protein
MTKHILAAILATVAAQSFAADYYLVVPVPNRAATAVAKIQVSLNAAALPAGRLDTAYAGFDFNSLLQVTGDSDFTAPGVQWGLAGGALPDGLALSASGVLAGTPLSPGIFSFTAKAAYKGQAGSAAYSVQVQGIPGIALQSGEHRTWADGAIAGSCNAYRQPGAGHTYQGDTGDGIYRVQPSGQPAINVFCDMTSDGGGWTLAARILTDDVSHTNAGAVGVLTSPSQSAPGKLADSVINGLAGTHMALRSDSDIRRYWQFAGIPFTAVGVAAARPLAETYLGVYAMAPTNGFHGGLNAFPTWPVIYGDAKPGSTCRRGMSVTAPDWCGAGGSGTMWVK